MVNRLLKLLKRDVVGIHKVAYLLAFSTLLSQILGLIRDRLLAHSFGAGPTLDIYYSAFRLQDFLFFSFSSLVSLTVLIPFLVDRINQNREETKKFLDTVFSAFFLGISIASITAFIFTPFLIKIIFPGFMGRGYDSALVNLARILLLSPVLLGVSSLFSSIIQVYQKFYIYAISPLLYNLGIIFGIVFLYPVFGVNGLGYGVLLGASMHLLIQVPFVFSQGLLPRFSFSWDWGILKKVIYLSLPRTFALSTSSISIIALFSLASYLKAGSVSVMSFAMNLQSVPLAIIGASYSMATFPTLAKHFSKGEHSEFLEKLSSAARHIVFWSMPVFVLFIVLRAQIVRVILGSGSFSWTDTRLTAACLAIFVASVVFQNLSLLFIRAYYACGNTKKPLLISSFSAGLTIIFGFVGIKLIENYNTFRFFIESLLRVDDITDGAVLMLPLAFTLSAIISTALFYFFFKRDFSKFSMGLAKTAWHSFAAAIFTGFVSYKFLEVLAGFLNLNSFIGIFLQGAIAGIIGVIAGVILLRILKNEELQEIIKAIETRISKVEVFPSEEVV